MRRSLFGLFLVGFFASSALAQQGAPLPAPLPAPPQASQSYPPQELDRIVSPIALYPDPLLAQVLAAATFSPDIPPAAQWADQHHYLTPAQLPGAIANDQLPWQPSVQALLPFPQVLGMMAANMPWTDEIGAAFLASPDQVMDAVQRQRQAAYNYGYLRSNAQIVVRNGPFIEIAPVDPAFIVVPVYSPAIVFARPRAGFVVSGAIRFGYGVTLGAAFAPWGWGSTRFAWNQRVVYVNNAPWRRTWANRAVYVHPFPTVPRYAGVRAAEQHALHTRDQQEREAARDGRARVEDHRRDEEHRHDDEHHR